MANDITYKIGSFGPAEDQFFYLVTKYARNQGLPHIYLSANSGARIGVAKEVMPLFSAAWNKNDHPEKDVNYLFLMPENFLKLQEKGDRLFTLWKFKKTGSVATRLQIS